MGLMAKKHLLVIDDEADLVTLLESRLKHSGYEVSSAGSAAEGVAAARSNRPDLILLDVSLPDSDGFDVCKRLRSDASTRRIPVIMLTARGTATDEVLGLELGADDYVTKPYDYRVLETRIKRLLQPEPAGRGAVGIHIADDRIELRDLEIDLRGRSVTASGRPVELTPMEFRILAALAGSPDRVFSRDELIAAGSKDGKADDPSRSIKINNHINNLRKKLGASADRIETVHGSGYRFRV
jgi:DNA-binding response OmpR family regulator